MSTVRLTCPCGHSWEYPQDQPVPADLRTICPACLSSDTIQAPAVVTPRTTLPGQVVVGFEIMEELNRRGINTLRGGTWHPHTVNVLIHRIAGTVPKPRKATAN